MTVLLDTRPAGLDALFRPADAFTVQFTWPAPLAGRTFTATLGGQALAVDVAGASLTVTASEAQTAAIEDVGSALFVLTETTGSDRAVVTGTWATSDRAAASQTAVVTVVDETVQVTISVIESGSFDAVQALGARVDALETQNDAPAATDQGMLSWAFDPVNSGGGSTLTNGTVWIVKLHLRQPVTVSNILWWQTSAFTTPTAGQCFVGLYDSTGGRLRTAAIEGQLTAAGLKSTPVTPIGLPAGWVWCAMVGNAATPGAIARSAAGGVPSAAAAQNAGLVAATARAATAGTGQTSLPVSFTPGSLTMTNILFWFALT